MAMGDRKKIEVIHHEFDWKNLDGHTLKNAAEYLLSLAKDLPPTAVLDEHWSGYEDMEIRVMSWRDETDEEYEKRMQEELRAAEYQKKKDAEEKARKDRLEQYHRLKREFG
jgi:hypothetical protein